MCLKTPKDRVLHYLCKDRLQFCDDFKPAEFVLNERYNHHRDLPYDPLFENRIMIDCVHGGDIIPSRLRDQLVANGPAGIEEELNARYMAEKDWGTDQIALRLAQKLGLKGYLTINVARVLMDFARFPGITPPNAGHLDRYAINYPFSYFLDYEGKKSVLVSLFDEISRKYETMVQGTILKIAIHTYDKYNPPVGHNEFGTLRPEASVIFRSLSFQQNQHMPVGIFDPLYPDVLAEFTVDRKLTSRISLNMEKAGYPVAHNYPYCLPDGSVEVRSQVWCFFQYLRSRFEDDYPDRKLDPAFKMVWNMLLDTNLRSTESELLRAYLHMYLKALPGREAEFRQAQKAYSEIGAYLNANRQEIVGSYRYSPRRHSSLAIEVRKDLVWNFEDEACRRPILGPEGLRTENVERISELVGDAVIQYLNEDRDKCQHNVFPPKSIHIS